MNVKKCDRCGHTYEKNKKDAKIMLINLDFSKKLDLQADLCEKCSEEFEKWLAGDDAPATVNVDGSAIQKAMENIENDSFLSKRFLETR